MAIPIYPNFTISKQFIGAAIIGNETFDRSQPFTLHLPFAQNLILALNQPDVNQLLGKLLTRDSFLAAVPNPNHVHAGDLVDEVNELFMGTLSAHWTTTMASRPNCLRTITVRELAEEINELWGPVVVAWARKWDPIIANMGPNINATQVGQNSAMTKAVMEELGRSLSVMIEVFLWWNTQYVTAVASEVWDLSPTRLDVWLQEQVDIWVLGWWEDVESEEGIEHTSSGSGGNVE
jgi:hypothetical protein